MYVKVRKLGKNPTDNQDITITILKSSTIKDIRKIVNEKFQIPGEKQKLFYKGKLLVDDHCVMDYNIQLNDVIQLMVVDDEPIETKVENRIVQNELDTTSDYYNLLEKVDFLDPDSGAWFEGIILKIVNRLNDSKELVIFKVQLECQGDKAGEEFDAEFDEIRPRAFQPLKKKELKEGQTYMINYNLDNPESRGYWYDFLVTNLNRKEIKGVLFVGKERTPINISIKSFKETMRIEKPDLITNRLNSTNQNASLRKNMYSCEICKDNPNMKCKECGCRICALNNEPKKLLLCDECNDAYHLFCLSPPLETIPEDDEWYCPSCKTDTNEIVKAGDKLKSKKTISKSSKTWGKGMANVGRTKECTIVPKDHLGPIPGVEVGTCWKFRLQVSEAGVHRPHVAGIHGREGHGAYSLILSGGYEDDVDNGEEFLYTGSGGRDLPKNKRSNRQTCDQTLKRMNKALALNCNTKLDEKGGEAMDWKGGKPVRVVRNYKLGRHSKYCPKEGNRYDGIYKVVKYYPEKGKSGFLVWRYLLRRDDPIPPPWSAQGQEFDVIYPPGFLEAQTTKENEPEPERNLKRKNQGTVKVFSKKRKISPFELSEEVKSLIESDSINEKLWRECTQSLKEGKNTFLAKVEETYMCICCQEIVYLPITTPCKHNICQKCLKRSFASKIYTCPHCRFNLGKRYDMNMNSTLSKILLEFFPGYQATRK